MVSLRRVKQVGRQSALLLMMCCALISTGATGLAQDAPITLMLQPGQSQTEIDAAIKAAGADGKPVVIRWTDAASAPETSPIASDVNRSGPVVAVDSMWMFSDLLSALTFGTQQAIDGMAGLPLAFSSSWDTLIAEEGGPGRALFSALLAAGCGLAVAYAVRMLLARLSSIHAPAHRFTIAALRLGCDLIAIMVLMAVAHLVLRQMTDQATFTRQVSSAILSVVTGAIVYASVGRFLFRRNGHDKPSLINIARPRWHFRMLLIYGVMNAFIGNSVRLADVRMVDATAADSWLFLTVSVLTLLKLWWFIAGRSDIARVFAGKDAGTARRMLGHFLADFYIVSAVFIWIAGLLVAGTSHNSVWARAAGTTQFLMVAIPLLDLGIVSLLGAVARRREAQQGQSIGTIILWSLRTPLAGAVWLAGLHIVVVLWQPLMMGATTLVTGWLLWLERLSLALIVSWSVCAFLIRYFESIAPNRAPVLPGQEDEVQIETSRITTILPVIRNLILGAVIAIAGLVIVSTAGVDVAPLLAGFGVLGLALSFGSQTLVKDVVSGIFFLAEDAFRIGEYIDTGKLMGTVEQISLRSVRLRHHNGPIHTIPFGQISSVTNYSRDWGTIKFELRFDRDADLELIRKTAKKVGIGMLDHPEFGDYFLVPVKMQGIHDVNETSMVIRFKFTARPGKPSLIKREAMKRLLAAFREAGLPLASNAVVVRSGSGSIAEGGAAATVIPLQANQG
jgi:moderate conductance mechanosensitive channel